MNVEAESIDAAEDAVGIGMDADKLQGQVKRLIEHAVNAADSEIAEHRRNAIRYYRGDKDIVEYEEGRSTIVSMDLMEAVNSYMPSLMRVFHGSQHAVEFIPKGPEDVRAAEQATDFLNQVYLIDNQGEAVTQAVFKDALYKLFGVSKVWWDDSIEVQTHHFTNLPEQVYRQVLAEPGVEAVAAESYPHPDLTEEEIAQFLAVGRPIPQLWDCEIRRRTQKGRLRVEAVPTDEFIIDPLARSFEEAHLIGHRCWKTESDLIAMGYDQEMVQEYRSNESRTNLERNERHRFRHTVEGDYIVPKILYTEVYVHMDYDGDGVAELRKVCCLGDSYEVVDNVPWDYQPFSHFVIDPEPHSVFGHDLFDKTRDIQRVQTAVLRNTMDSLYLSMNPRPTVLSGQVDIDSVTDTSLGAVAIEYTPGAIRWNQAPFVGRDALPIMDKLESKKEDRIGVSKASAGLNADALQSSTLMAVNATVQGAQEKKELVARNLARGFAHMFGLMLKTLVKNQDQAKMVRLRGEWVEVDPTVWDASMDVRVNVGLGTGMPDQKIQGLMQIIQMQQQAMERLGPQNPLVGLGNIRHTMGKVIELMGYQDTAQFFKQIPINYEIPPAPETPDPQTILAQAQAQALQTQSQIDMMRLELDRQKAMDLSDRERDRMEVDLMTESAKLDAKYKHDMDVEVLKASLNQPRN